MNIEPFEGPFGADVTDVDLANISDGDFERLYQAWLDHGVLRIRDQQSLDDAGLERFSARFGPLEEIPVKLPPEVKVKLPSLYVTALSNIEVNGRPIGGLGNAEAAWHSDMTYLPNPPPASVLLSIEIPETGGDTQFACQRAALEALPSELRERVGELRIKHDAAHTSVGELRPGFEEVTDPRETPGATHPIVLTHPETGRDALFLGRRDYAYIEGLPLEESEALLDELWRHAALSENVWTQHWNERDVIIWDNRRVLHRRDEFPATSRRLLKRCQVLARETASQHRSGSSA